MCTFKNSYFSKFDCKKIDDMSGQLQIEYIKSFKTFNLKKILYGNMFFGEKNPKKDNNPKCKITHWLIICCLDLDAPILKYPSNIQHLSLVIMENKATLKVILCMSKLNTWSPMEWNTLYTIDLGNSTILTMNLIHTQPCFASNNPFKQILDLYLS